MSNVQLASAIVDALATFRNNGFAPTPEQKLEIAKEFTNNYNPDITNEELAEDFLRQLFQTIRKRGIYHRRVQREQRLAAEELAELEASLSNFGDDPVEPEPDIPEPPEEPPP